MAEEERQSGSLAGNDSRPVATQDADGTAQAAPAAGDSSLLEEDTLEDVDGFDETEQGFVHVRTSLFAVGTTLASLIILILLAGNVYQYIHYRSEATIATVNGAPITQTEFLRAAGQQDQALQSLIDQKLIQQEARKQKVSVPDSEVNNEIGTIKQQLGTQQEFNAALKRANLTEPQLRDQIRTQRLAMAMGAKGVNVSDDDAQKFYDQNKAQFANQTVDQAKDQIKVQLLQQKQNEAIQQWIAGLRSKAKIVMHFPA